MRSAVFFDRDGTLIEDPGYVGDPAAVRLLPGAAEAVARLNAVGLAAVVVTNQSGIARGLFSDADYRSVAGRLEELLAASNARLDGQYYCPHLPEITGPCECRKPEVLLFRHAAAELGLDLGRSWWVGDKLSDLVPSLAFGGQAILVRTGEGSRHESEASRAGFRVAADVNEAVAVVLAEGRANGTKGNGERGMGNGGKRQTKSGEEER